MGAPPPSPRSGIHLPAFLAEAAEAWAGRDVLVTGTAIAGTILWLAALGFLFYLVLRVISPSTADKLRDMVKGRRAES